jgi:hypothetical protein
VIREAQASCFVADAHHTSRSAGEIIKTQVINSQGRWIASAELAERARPRRHKPGRKRFPGHEFVCVVHEQR